MFVQKDYEFEKSAARWFLKPPEEWPDFTISWNFNPECFHLSLDSVSSEEFNDLYPCVLLGIARIQDIKAHFLKGAIRLKECWHEPYARSTSQLIERWYRQWPVTPPYLGIANQKIIFLGGYHRFYLAEAHAEKKIPFLFSLSDKEEIQKLLPMIEIF